MLFWYFSAYFFLTDIFSYYSVMNINKMISEMYRVLAHNGIYISLSLHGESDVIDYFMTEELDWHVFTYRLRNPRWDERGGVKRSTAHTLVVCHKLSRDEESFLSKINLGGVLSDKIADSMQRRATKAVEERLFRVVTPAALAEGLDSALQIYMELMPDTEE
jgi:hypothetical protein